MLPAPHATREDSLLVSKNNYLKDHKSYTFESYKATYQSSMVSNPITPAHGTRLTFAMHIDGQFPHTYTVSVKMSMGRLAASHTREVTTSNPRAALHSG